MTDENEKPGATEIAKAAISKQQGQRNREPRNCQRQRDDLFDDPGETPSPDMQRIGSRNASDSNAAPAEEISDSPPATT